MSLLMRPWNGTIHSPVEDRSLVARAHHWQAVLPLVLVTGYTLITILNLTNNRANVARMQAANCLQHAKVLTQSELEGDENASSMEEMIFYFWKKGDHEEAKRIKALRERLYPDKTLDKFGWPPDSK